MQTENLKKVAIGVTAATVFAVVPFVQPATAEAGWLGDVLGSVIGAAATPKNAVTRNSATQIDKILHQACDDNDYDMAVDAINKGANVNSMWKDTFPLGRALHYARFHEDDTKMADLLISHGADLEGWYDSKRCHFYAFSDLNNDLVLYLLDKGMNVNLKGDGGISLLMDRAGRPSWYSEEKNHFDTHPRAYYMQQYVNRGADVNVRASADAYSGSGYAHHYLKGQTALFAIAEENDIESARVLLYAGADKNIRDREGKTALDYAIDKGNSEMIKLLMNWHGAN